MAANVLFVIIPSQRKLVDAKEPATRRTRSRDARQAALGAQQLPHAAGAADDDQQPLSDDVSRIRTRGSCSSCLLVLAAWVRHFFNLRHRAAPCGRFRYSAAIAIAVLAILIRPAERVERGDERGSVHPDRADRRGELRAVPLRKPRRRSTRRRSGSGSTRRTRSSLRRRRSSRSAVHLDHHAARERHRDDAGRARPPRAVDRRRTRRSPDVGDHCRRVPLHRPPGGGDGAARQSPRSDGILPLESKIIQARWSGQSDWIRCGELDVGIGPENATSYPPPGELALYPGGDQRDGAALPVRPVLSLRAKAGQLCREPLRDDRRGQRATAWSSASSSSGRARSRSPSSTAASVLLGRTAGPARRRAEAEACGAGGDEHEREDRGDVREHRVETGAARDVVALQRERQRGESAEEVRADQAERRPPEGEDHERDRDPPARASGRPTIAG